MIQKIIRILQITSWLVVNKYHGSVCSTKLDYSDWHPVIWEYLGRPKLCFITQFCDVLENFIIATAKIDLKVLYLCKFSE